MLSGTPANKSRNRVTYEAHVINVRALQKAMIVAERAHRRAIRRQNGDEERLLLLVLFTISGIWAENVLRRVVYTRGLFNDKTRSAILQSTGGYATKQRDRWTALVDRTLFTRYNVHKASDLRPYAQVWRKRLSDAVHSHVIPIIDDRNRLAHGGWAIELDGDVPRLAPSAPLGDYLALRRRRVIVLQTSELLVDLLRSTKSTEPSLRKRMALGLGTLARMEGELIAYDPVAQRMDVLRTARRVLQQT